MFDYCFIVPRSIQVYFFNHVYAPRIYMIYCHDNSCLLMWYVKDAMVVQIEGQRGIRDQLCVARQSRTFDQGTDHERSGLKQFIYLTLQRESLQHEFPYSRNVILFHCDQVKSSLR